MARRRRQRTDEKRQRHAPPTVRASDVRVVVREASRVERLAYTPTQAAQALGISTSTFNRRVLPFIETLQMDSGTRLIPVNELEHVLAERRQQARAKRRLPALPGRKSLGEIARRLNTDGVKTSQGGRQWWPSTVRSVLVRSRLPEATQASAESARRR